MNITTVEQMESVVQKNKSLSWDGWTVVNSYPSDKARTSNKGAFINGVWCIQNRFVPSTSGWDIPDKFMR